MGIDMVLINDTVCFLSSKGHKNFYYPSSIKAIIKKGSTADKLSYVSGSNKKYSAWLISKSDIIPLTVNDFNVINLLYSSNNTKLVVWTKKHSHLAQLVRASDC